MEQYSNLNVHGKIKQLDTQTGRTPDDAEVVRYDKLEERVPTAMPTTTAADAGKAPVVDSNGAYVLTPVGLVDDVVIDGGSSIVNKTAGTTGYKTATIPIASGQTKGLVKVGTNISVSEGTISVPTASSNTPGVVKVGTTLSITEGVLNGAYSAGAGIALSGTNNTTIEHSNTVTAATAGTSDATSGATLAVPYVTYDEQGHVTASGTHTHTINSLAASTIASGTLASERLPDATPTAKGAVTVVRGTSDTSISVPTQKKMEDYVTDVVTTSTANFLGTLDVESDLGLSETATQTQVVTALNAYTSWPSTPTKNDYCFVKFDLEQDPGNIDRYDRYKYTTGTNSTWAYEYTLNNSSFSSDQWAAINSKIYNSDSSSTPRSVDVVNIVIGPSSATADHIALFDGATGKAIKNSSYTIATSVPNNALFTDQNVTQTSASDNTAYPVLFASAASPTGNPAGTKYTANVKINPSTGNITATKVNGLTLTAADTGFTISGGSTNGRTLTVGANYTLAAACAKAVTDSTSASAISTGTSLPTERDIYYGLPYINNSHAYTSGTTIYAPTEGGTSGYILKANGATSTPTWIAQSEITAGHVSWSGVTDKPINFSPVNVPPE